MRFFYTFKLFFLCTEFKENGYKYIFLYSYFAMGVTKFCFSTSLISKASIVLGVDFNRRSDIHWSKFKNRHAQNTDNWHVVELTYSSPRRTNHGKLFVLFVSAVCVVLNFELFFLLRKNNIPSWSLTFQHNVFLFHFFSKCSMRVTKLALFRRNSSSFE